MGGNRGRENLNNRAFSFFSSDSSSWGERCIIGRFIRRPKRVSSHGLSSYYIHPPRLYLYRETKRRRWRGLGVGRSLAQQSSRSVSPCLGLLCRPKTSRLGLLFPSYTLFTQFSFRRLYSARRGRENLMNRALLTHHYHHHHPGLYRRNKRISFECQ